MSAERSRHWRARRGYKLELDEAPLARILVAMALFVWLMYLIIQSFLANPIPAHRAYSRRTASFAPAPGRPSRPDGGPLALCSLGSGEYPFGIGPGLPFDRQER